MLGLSSDAGSICGESATIDVAEEGDDLCDEGATNDEQ
jgi:hypothetical protein